MTAPALALCDLDEESGDAYFAELRGREFARLDHADVAYLDYTGAALYAERQIAAHASRLREGIFGNPHSENGPSRRSTWLIEQARARVLSFLDAPADEYTVCFTANTTAAIRLVGEGFAFDPDSGLVLSADNHNSMNGLREFARRRRAQLEYLPLDADLRLEDPVRHLRRIRSGMRGTPLFGFPAQSNFSGVKHQLDLVELAREMGYAVILDAAAFLPASPLSLRRTPADFVAFSAYKIVGHPTGVGALVARRESLARLERPWFSGGTVEYASVQHGTHLLRDGPEAFEDGTPAFLDVASLADGLDFLEDVGRERVRSHALRMTGRLLDDLRGLMNADGTPLVKLHGPEGLDGRGSTIAFNVIRPDGTAIPFADVVERARDAGVALRGGCFCNPGAAESAFAFPKAETKRCLRLASANGFSIEKLSACLGPAVPVGAVRASLGIASNLRDTERAIDVIASFA